MDNEDEKHDTTKLELVKTCPYTIPISLLPLSFQIITVTTVNNKQYESNISKSIMIDIPNKPNIKDWSEFFNLIQVLSADEDSIQIQFITNKPIITKTKYMIQNINDSEDKISQPLILRSDSSKKIDVQVETNKLYTFGVFLNGKQISNSLSVQTVPINFNINNYSPSPPSLDTMKQFYDKNKQNILIIWNCPKCVFGDKIIYKIVSLDKSQSEEIVKLPYKISVLERIDVKITTIAIVNGKRYEGSPSNSIHFGI
eukprot:455682_1